MVALIFDFFACVAFTLFLGRAPTLADETVGRLVEREDFGQTARGEAVDLYTLDNREGLRVRLITYGGTVLSIEVPDRNGARADVALGFKTLGEYERDSPYFGAIIGRYANRIAGGRFSLDGQEYRLATNEGNNQLHGGTVGFDKVVWQAEVLEEPGVAGVVLSHVSSDGDQGFPGVLRVQVTYRLTESNGLRIDYRANTDRPTPVNLTHHTYFNLGGHDSGDVLGHTVRITASRFTPVRDDLIPSGEQRFVVGTPFDFRHPKSIGRDIAAEDEQLGRGRGFDHNWVLDGGGKGLVLAARVTEPGSGRVMEVHTTEPGMQFYSGNFLDGSLRGKGGSPYVHRAGFCLETQHFPDSPNQPSFPSTILRPDETYKQTTVYRFSTL